MDQLEQQNCTVCWDTIETPVFLINQTATLKLKLKLKYCWECAKEEQASYYSRWQKSIDEADCAASLRRILLQPPPMTFADVISSAEAQAEAISLRLCCGDEVIDAHLVGAPRNESERQLVWEKLKNLHEETKQDK